MKKYRVVIIGFGHMHINDVASHFYENPRTEIVACADTVPAVPELRKAPYTREWNREFCVTNFNIPKVYDDYIEMLDTEKPDLAIITSENIRHREIVRACAERGININVEKPMAVSLSDALDMKRAAEQNNVTLIVNWPVTWVPIYMKMKRMIDDGAIGKILEFKIRTSHTGPLGAGASHKGVTEHASPMTGKEKSQTWWHRLDQGGGSMYDFCCYGSMLSHWLLGEDAESVFGMRVNLDSQYGDADDNAMMLVRYPTAVASIETSWTTPQELIPSNMPMIYGTKGAMTVILRDGEEVLKVIANDGTETIYTADPVEEKDKDIACAFVHHMDTGDALHPTLSLDINMGAMRILDAGVRSAKSGKMEACNSAYWQIG